MGITQEITNCETSKDLNIIINNMNIGNKRQGNKIIALLIDKILIFRMDLKILKSRNVTFNQKFIYHAFIDEIYNLDLSLAKWDWNGRIIKDISDEEFYKTLKIDIKNCSSSNVYKLSFIKGRNKNIKLFLEYGKENSEFYLYNKIQLLEYFFPRKCKNCQKILHYNKTLYRDGLFRMTCSEKCEYELSSKRMSGNGNSYYKTSPETLQKVANNLSIIMKEKIKNGEFTPCVTNSWARSRTYINNKPLRSSWEAMFYMLNLELDYETKRIQYIDENSKERNYIVDFEDKENKILYEVKPNSTKTEGNNQLKEEYALKWCKQNDYKFSYISDEWFIENLSKIKDKFNKIKDDLDKESRRKIQNGINGFAKIIQREKVIFSNNLLRD